jgi:type II secretory pathway pseudopilin PulG
LGTGATGRHGYTLLEVALVVGLLVAISAMVVPRFVGEIEKNKLPGSAGQMRSLITLTRANAAFDGKRYRIRFAGKDEEVKGADRRQPIVEREEDPVRDPELYSRVTAPWAVGDTLLGDVWCAEVRTGRPTIEKLQDLRRRGRDDISEEMRRQRDAEHFEPERPPLVIEPDGASEWVTFVLTEAPLNTPVDDLEGFARLEVICEGSTGLSWVQRPFYDEELDLFEEKGWPAVLRQDFTTSRELTENDVLELRDVSGKPTPAQEP